MKDSLQAEYEKFDELLQSFDDWSVELPNSTEDIYSPHVDYKKLKSFLKSHDQRVLEKIREMCEEMKKIEPHKFDQSTGKTIEPLTDPRKLAEFSQMKSFDSALSSLQQQLTELK